MAEEYLPAAPVVPAEPYLPPAPVSSGPYLPPPPEVSYLPPAPGGISANPRSKLGETIREGVKIPILSGVWRRMYDVGESVGGLIYNFGRAEVNFYKAIAQGKTPQEASQDFTKGTEHVGQIGETLAGGLKERPGATLASFISPQIGKAVEEGSMAPILNEPGETLFDLMLAGPTVGMPLAGLAAKPATALAAKYPSIGRAVQKVVPKFNYTDQMYALEAERQGEYMAKSLMLSEPSVKELSELLKTQPEALDLLGPERFTKTNVKEFGKKLEHQRQAGVGAGMQPGKNIPFRFTAKKGDLSLAVDEDGWITYGKADLFNTLPKSVQDTAVRVRTLIDTFDQEIATRELYKPKDWQAKMMSYLHEMYEINYDSKAWVKELRDNRPWVINDAAEWLMKHYTKASKKGGTLPPTPAEVTGFIDRLLTPQMYRQVLSNPEHLLTMPGSFTGDVVSLLRSKKIPEPIRQLIGPLAPTENAIRVGHTLDAQIRIITNDNAMQKMSTLFAKDGGVLLTKPGTLPPNARYIEIPDSIAFGRWAGGYVHPDIADAIPTMKGTRFAGNISRFLQSWKASKTIWNPQTHVNNWLGNVMFSHFVGANIMNPANAGYYTSSIKELAGYVSDRSAAAMSNPELRNAIRYGVVRPGFAGSELTNMAKRIQGITPKTHSIPDYLLNLLTETRVATKLKDVYDVEDQIFRYAAFKKLRSQGWSDTKAAVEVNKYFPSYAVSSKLGNFLRGQGSLLGMPGNVGQAIAAPYTSFPLEAARIFSVAAKEHPWRLFAANTLPLSANVLNMGDAGMTPEDYHAFLGKIPRSKRGQALIAASRGNGEVDWVNITNAWPMSNLWTRSERTEQLFGTEGPSFPGSDLVMSGPLWEAASFIQNVNPFTGAPLYDRARGETFADAVGKGTGMLPIPPFPLQPATRAWYAAEGVPWRRGMEPESVLNAMLYGTLPSQEPRTSEELLHQGKLENRGEVSEAKRGFRGIMRKPTLFESERENKAEAAKQERRRRRGD